MVQKQKKRNFIVLIFVIIKNLFLIIFEEIGLLFKRLGFKKGAVFVVLLAALGAGGYWGLAKYKTWRHDPRQVSLKEAAKEGEMKTYKLLIQIENPKGNPEDIKGRYERGDIVLTAPADRQFSQAEESGFLIIKMDLTQTQAEVLLRPQVEEKPLELFKKDDREGPEGPEPEKQIKRRRYRVNLEKIGIAPDDFKGRVIDDKTFKWDVVLEDKED